MHILNATRSVLLSCLVGMSLGVAGCYAEDVDDAPASTSDAEEVAEASGDTEGVAEASGNTDSGEATSGAAMNGGEAGGAEGAATLPDVSVYIAGDSTVSTYKNSPIHQAGWGQMLHEYFNGKVHVENRAVGGRTSRRFIDEGRLQDVLSDIHAGDYLLVQFGTNDSNKTATYELNGKTIPYYLAPSTDYKTYLKKYISGARAHNAVPVLVTPPPRRSCTGDSHNFGNGLAAYAQAMKELGHDLGVAVIDLNQATLTYLNTIGCVAAGAGFFLIKADGKVDSTHFQEQGARIMGGFVADGTEGASLSLAKYLK